MFTGIIEETGKVQMLQKGRHSAILHVLASRIMEDIRVGHSIAVNGVCLTVTSLYPGGFTADVTQETLNRSSLCGLVSGSPVNLERAMPLNGRFGGHIVLGHIDGTGVISEIQKDDNAFLYTVTTPPLILRYIVEKGSIAIDGISLTVSMVQRDRFQVVVIPHTVSLTTLSRRRAGDLVNLENDCIGKYVERLMGTASKASPVTAGYLIENGF